MARGWRFWIDQGGTFTDLVAVDPQGEMKVGKLLSQNPERYDDAPVQGIRDLLGLPRGAAIPEGIVESVRMGTTVATNALLERKGERLGLLVTEGFEDLLEIGYQDRPSLFELRIEKPEPLAAKVAGVPERVAADGAVLKPLDEEAVGKALSTLHAAGIRSLAVVLLHAYRFPFHELRIGELAKEAGFTHVSLSHQVACEMKAVGRGDTTCVDAYLTPVLRRYLDRMQKQLPRDARLFMMQSSGGLASADRFTGKNAVLSGPAGGLVAVASLAKESGFEKVIGFDMGGTSTDVSRYEGWLDRTYETRTAGVRLKAPMLRISTVAAGGGSILRFEGGRFLVGPESAGANPGPACYRRGGPLAITDANLVLGRIQPRFFPHCFGPGADQPLDPEAPRKLFAKVADRVREATGHAMTIEQVAAGFTRIANESMAKPIKEISTQKGYDVREYALVGFGGAAGQHACALAETLGMGTVILHPLAGCMSAYGMGLADVVDQESRAILRELTPASLAGLEPMFSELEARGRKSLLEQGIEAGAIELRRSIDLRYKGVDESLNVRVGPGFEPMAEFERLHRQLYGFLQPGTPVEIENLRVEAVGAGDRRFEPSPQMVLPRRLTRKDTKESAEVWWADGAGGIEHLPTPLFARAALRPGDEVVGPAIVTEAISTIAVDPGWVAQLSGKGHLILRRAGGAAGEKLSTRRDPVTLELFNNLFMSCAEQMGRTLERVSHSTNIKERLDFSCAIFDRTGELIANAPHIPVHLGAMGATVKAVQAEHAATMKPGDVYVSNDPYAGGSHLPDVTVVTPVYGADGTLRFWVANRGHHADIGGISPGSMPPFSRSIDEEGIRIRAFKLVEGGKFREAEILALLGSGPYPARNPRERLSDLRAQVASNQAGARLLDELARKYGYDVLAAYMGHILDNGEEAVRELLATFKAGRYSFFDYLDEGHRIAVDIDIAGTDAVLDFSGTDPQIAGNLNAPRAVVEAAVLYVFRCLCRRSIPLNGGCLRPLTLKIVEGSLLSPKPPAAVVGGNVETSQRVVDVLLGALGKLSAAQGTMNNLTFGNPGFGYYETICGGAGAGFGFDGAHAVHTHMTNTRITDPEVIEHRYPVRMHRFGIRHGSGGEGIYPGGDGVVREIEFLEPVTASILSERRGVAPFGLHGAASGQRGRNRLVRGTRTVELPGKVRIEALPGDRLRLETPGAGGYEPTPAEWARIEPAELRRLARLGRFRRPTPGHALGHVQANLIVLPAAAADSFEEFCRRNPRPCPLLERLPPGDPLTRVLADRADIRTDLPGYLLHRRGRVERVDDLQALWTRDAVAFLLGCSFTFEGALTAAGLPIRHIEQGRNVPMYRTDRPLAPAGWFGGSLVVSMRPYRPEQADAVSAATAPYSRTHGAPIFYGDASQMGIDDLARPDWGDPVDLKAGEVPFLWACGVTSQEACTQALREGHLEWFASHAPGHMFVADMRDDDLRDPGSARP